MIWQWGTKLRGAVPLTVLAYPVGSLTLPMVAHIRAVLRAVVIGTLTVPLVPSRGQRGGITIHIGTRGDLWSDFRAGALRFLNFPGNVEAQP